MSDNKTTENASPLSKLSANQAKSLIENASLIRSSFLTKLFDDRRDIDDECGYSKTITMEQYSYLYDREGVAKRVVALLPDDSWKVDPEIEENSESEETEFEEAWRMLQKEHNLYHYMHRVDELSGIGQFGILLLGLSDGGELKDPVPGINERGEPTEEGAALELTFVRAFDQSAVSVFQQETDQINPRFNQPTMYKILFQDAEALSKGQQSSITGDTSGKTTLTNPQSEVMVHWTRVIHIADNRKTSDVYGIPRMQNVYNRLMDIRKVLSGSGEMFWKGAFPGYSFEMTPEAIAGGATIDATAMRAEFEDFSNGLQRYIATTGITAKSLLPQVADPKNHLESQFTYIAIALSVPLRIFLGSEQAKLASTQDKDTWNGRIRRRQERYLSPMLIRPFVDRLLAFGVLPEPAEGYTVAWPDLSTPSDKDIAELAKDRTDALAKYVHGAVDQLIPPAEYLTKFMNMEPEDVEAILEAALSQMEQEAADGRGTEE